MLESEEKFGFIIIDGNGALFGTLCGNTREVLHQFEVDLPKKHGRGGQSALRFARYALFPCCLFSAVYSRTPCLQSASGEASQLPAQGR